MCTITRLKYANRKGSRTLIELDGRPWEEVDTEVVLERHLAKGQTLDADLCAAILEDSACADARRAAAILLATRLRSVAELRRRLRQRRFDPVVVDRTIAYFSELGGLDDALFARRYASHLFKTRTIGPRKVAARLRELGVAQPLIAETLEAEPEAQEDRQAAAAERFLERRLARKSAEAPARLRAKLRAALVRAGFEAEVFEPLLKRALGSERDDSWLS